jgi:hypothetical protein
VLVDHLGSQSTSKYGIGSLGFNASFWRIVAAIPRTFMVVIKATLELHE